MIRSNRFVCGAVALATLLAAPAVFAHGTEKHAAEGHGATTAPESFALTIEHPWMRQPPPGAEVAGGYATITNPTDAADRLIGASAPFAKSTEIHEMSMVDGMMRMQPVAGGLEIPAGGTVELAPGGYHVMFLELLDQPQAGDTVDVTLEFEHSGSITVPMSVAPIGAQKPAMDMGSGHHMGHGQ